MDRSKKDCPLTKLLATSLERKLELKRALGRAVLLDADDLGKAMNQDKVGTEIEKVKHVLNVELTMNPPVTARPGHLNKPD